MLAASLVIAYLIGSVPFGELIARQRGRRDLRRTGSGNIGAANITRTLGLGAGVLVAALDIGKGAASVLLAGRMSASAGAAAAAGLAAVLGHVYPVWLRFHGGKGVATTCGAFLVLAPVAVCWSFLVFVGGAWMTRYISVGSMAAAAALPLVAYGTGSPRPVMAASVAATALILVRHRSNLARVWSGTEHRFGVTS